MPEYKSLREIWKKIEFYEDRRNIIVVGSLATYGLAVVSSTLNLAPAGIAGGIGTLLFYLALNDHSKAKQLDREAQAYLRDGLPIDSPGVKTTEEKG